MRTNPLSNYILASILTACVGDGAELTGPLGPDPERMIARDPSPLHEAVIMYRGQPTRAEVHEGRLFVEGDILVHERDIYEPPDPEGSIAKGNGKWDATANFKWPDGVIHYRFGDLIGVNKCANETADCNPQRTETQWKNLIRAAMDTWEEHTFVEFIEDVDESEYDHIEIVGADKCSSAVGRVGGPQELLFASGCLLSSTFPFKFQHELGHAMGLHHEHQRTDRDTYVSVADLQKAEDYPQDFDKMGRRLGAYDCDSVMHYGWSDFTIKEDLGVPRCTGDFGQRNHLSAGDIAAVRALYPRLVTRPFLFANTGLQRLCHLEGRDSDANTYFEVAAWGGAFGPALSTDGLAPGDHLVHCSYKSCFWMSNYSYPATTVTKPGDSCGTLAESEGDTSVVRVANPGLIAILF